MADHLVTIKSNGTCSPSRLGEIVPGEDTVSFVCEAEGVAIIRIDRADVFGADQFEISSGTKKILTVRNDASQGGFSYQYSNSRGETLSNFGRSGDGTVIGGPGMATPRSPGDGSVIGGPD